ncbi:MAG TPA: winged helix-turn-helix domain-containing protein [Xanthobacteraceae bacterium]|jgi:predicted ATPase/DNA-binding winged helix-turn-helix (wHTH) protein|nr:winged helix-turn-helix domain-containing protein [Xanthobacteraceae bacterium]
MDGHISRMHGVVSFGPFRLSMGERQLKKDDEPLQLGGRALDTLIALVDRAGEVVTQKELIARVWPDVTVEEANLRVHIANLRKALGDGHEDARYIVTVPGRGYCFVAPVTAAAPQSSPPTEATVSDWLHRLPPRLTRMIGRDDTIRVLSAQLMTYRFVSIVGAGGVGKTTVAVSVAHALLDGFNGAIFFVDLAALTDAKLVPTTVASALGFMMQTKDPLRSLPAFIGDRKILLVLDNCEHVIDSAATLAERIVGETPQTHVLTTSREALRVEGERVHLLYALDCPPEEVSLTSAEALNYPAAQLFMERAVASGYGGVLNDIEAPIVTTICRRLDGIPLAIELAASRAGPLGIRGVGELLDNRFSLLWRGRRTALPRHQTLNAMLDWSYNLLSQHEKVVLGRLSVFVGNFTLDAAYSVAADAEIDQASSTRAITSLLAKSLISKSESRGSTYYRLLETTRTFAAAKLAERGAANRVGQRHAKFFSEFLQRDQLVQSRFGEHDLSGYAAYIGNVRAALQWAFSDDGDVTLGVELAAWAAPLFVGLSLLEECTRWCERALACLDAAAQGTRQEMILQEALALSLMYTGGNGDQVRAAIERGLHLEEAFGDVPRKLQLFLSLYSLLMRLADFRGALKVAEQSGTFAETAKDPAGLLVADFMLGGAYHYIGDQAAAQFYGERAMARAAEPGTSVPNFVGFDHRTYAPISLSRALWLRGFADRARSIAKTAIDEAASGVHPISICVSLAYGSPVFLGSGDLQSVENYTARLIENAERHSIEPYRAVGLGLKGAVAIARDELETGIDLLRVALEILTTLRLKIFVTEFMGVLADGLRKHGQVEEALLTINQAIGRPTDCGSTYDLAELLRVKAQILAAIPAYGRDSAINCLTEALAVAKSQSALALELKSTIALARLLAEGGQRDQARHDLALIYGRFTEGFETADLRVARQLMAELA